MPPHIFENVEFIEGAADAPLRSVQTTPGRGKLFRQALLTALAALILLPQLTLAGYALTTPETRDAILAAPMASLQLLVAMLFWITMFLWPLRNLAAHLISKRSIEITTKAVSVADCRPFGTVTRWRAPIETYRGVAHHVRSSLSGTRHELMLVNRDPRRSVLLMTGPAASNQSLDRLSRRLRLPIIPGRELYPTPYIGILRAQRWPAGPLPA